MNKFFKIATLLAIVLSFAAPVSTASAAPSCDAVSCAYEMAQGLLDLGAYMIEPGVVRFITTDGPTGTAMSSQLSTTGEPVRVNVINHNDVTALQGFDADTFYGSHETIHRTIGAGKYTNLDVGTMYELDLRSESTSGCGNDFTNWPPGGAQAPVGLATFVLDDVTLNAWDHPEEIRIDPPSNAAKSFFSNMTIPMLILLSVLAIATLKLVGVI